MCLSSHHTAASPVPPSASLPVQSTSQHVVYGASIPWPSDSSGPPTARSTDPADGVASLGASAALSTAQVATGGPTKKGPPPPPPPSPSSAGAAGAAAAVAAAVALPMQGTQGPANPAVMTPTVRKMGRRRPELESVGEGGGRKSRQGLTMAQWKKGMTQLNYCA